MTSRRYNLTVSAIVVTSVVLSLAIFPTETDTPLLFTYDKQYQKAYSIYRSLYDEGDRSQRVVIPLVKILLESSRNGEAISIMEDYVNTHGQSPDALEYLGKIYRNSNRSFNYLETLEKLYEVRPSENILREQEKYYDYVGDIDKKIKVLETLVQRYKPKQEDFLKLTSRYLLNNNQKQANETLDHYLNVYSARTLDADTLDFTVNLLANQNRQKDILALALDYYKSHSDLESAIQVIYILQEQKFYVEAREILSKIPQKDRYHPEVVASEVSLLLSQKQNFLAYEVLRHYFAMDKVPTTMIGPLVNLAIDYRDDLVLNNILSSPLLSRVSDVLFVKIIEKSSKDRQSQIIKRLNSELPSGFLKDHPSVAEAFVVGDSSLSFDEKRFLLKNLDQQLTTNVEKGALAQLAQVVGDTYLARDYLQSIHSFEDIPFQNLEQIVNLYATVGMADEGWKKIQRLHHLHQNSDEVTKSWLILAAATGHDNVVLDWFNGQKNLNPNFIAEVFYIAYQYKQPSLAMHLAKVLNRVSPQPKSRIIMAQALELNGYYEAAHEVYQDLLDNGENVNEQYVMTLVKLATTKERFKSKLRSVIHDFINSKVLTEEGYKNLAYSLQELNLLDEAEEVFLGLSDDNTFDSDVVQSLLWLRGNKSNQRILDWAVSQLAGKPQSEKVKWLQYFFGQEEYQLVIDNIEKNDWESDEIADLLLESMVYQKDKEQIEELIAYVIPQESRIPRLKRYGKLANDSGLKTIANTIYSKVLTFTPSDHESLLMLGEIAFSQGIYTEAKHYLCQSIEFGDESFQPYYLLGDIYSAQGDPWRAQWYHTHAYQILIDKVELSDYEQSIKAYLLYRLHYVASAIDEYEKLMRLDQGSIYHRIDYANMLIDLECYQRAYELLFDPKLKPLTPQEYESLVISRARYYKQQLRFNCAAAELCQLSTTPRKLAASADLSFSKGKWRESLSELWQAQLCEPDNQIYCLSRREIWRGYRPGLEFGTEYRVTGIDQREWYGRVTASHYVSPFTRLSLFVDVDDIDLKAYTKPSDGVVEAVETTKYRGEVLLGKFCFNGDELGVSGFFADNVLGVGGSYRHLDSMGSSVFILEYHRPNWDFTQTIIDDGSRDMIAIGRTQWIYPRLTGNFNFSYNRYNLYGIEQAATSYAMAGGLVFQLPVYHYLGCFSPVLPVITLNYNVDSEFPTAVKERLDPFGNPYDPLPLVNREVHSWTCFISTQPSQYMTLEAYGGYSVDRQVGGVSVPVYGANLFLGKRGCQEVSFIYSHSTSTESSQLVVNRYICDVKLWW